MKSAPDQTTIESARDKVDFTRIDLVLAGHLVFAVVGILLLSGMLA